MLSVHPSTTRFHERPASSQGSVWHSLGASGDSGVGSFHGLTVLDENLLAPGSEALHGSQPAELLTYVVEGALRWEDERGSSGVLRAGEVLRSLRGAEHRLREANASQGDWVSFFQIAFGPPRQWMTATHTHRHFPFSSRRGAWRVVASSDGRDGSLPLDEDAVVASVLVEPGQHVVYPLGEQRAAWLHVISGRIHVGDVELSSGDAVSMTDAFALSVTAKERSELLLIEVSRDRPSNGAP
jgi:hypothetical protein